MSYSYHGRAWERQQCQQVANQIENQLLNAGAIVHRYDAQSGSVYLKIDYGVGYSIRISNHRTKKDLNYKFNIFLESQPGMRGAKRWTEGEAPCLMQCWTRDNLKSALAYILATRTNRMAQLGDDYQKKMEQQKAKLETCAGYIPKFYLHRTTHEVVRGKDGKKIRLYPNYIELARANNSRRQTPKES